MKSELTSNRLLSVTRHSMDILVSKPADQPIETSKGEIIGFVVLDLPDPDPESNRRFLLVNYQGDPRLLKWEEGRGFTEIKMRSMPKELRETFKDELDDWGLTLFLDSLRLEEMSNALYASLEATPSQAGRGASSGAEQKENAISA